MRAPNTHTAKGNRLHKSATTMPYMRGFLLSHDIVTAFASGYSMNRGGAGGARGESMVYTAYVLVASKGSAIGMKPSCT